MGILQLIGILSTHLSTGINYVCTNLMSNRLSALSNGNDYAMWGNTLSYSVQLYGYVFHYITEQYTVMMIM